jgi:hypothetical protein
MSYGVLSAIVVVNAVVTLRLIIALWQMAKAGSPAARLPKKVVKLLWHSEPIVPKHNPPKIDVSKISGLGERSKREFFVDFREFAEAVNFDLVSGPSHGGAQSHFRLQDEPADDVGFIVPTDGPTPGRLFRLFYNQYPIGSLEIMPVFLGYTTETPHVRTDVEIDMARYLRYGELTRFLETIASAVTKSAPFDPRSDYPTQAQLAIEAALTEVLWGDYESSSLVVHFDGLAESYLALRADWLKTAATSR